MTQAENDLEALAAAHGVATHYENWRNQPVTVPPGTVRAVLAAMGVPAATPEEVGTSLGAARRAPAGRPAPTPPAGPDDAAPARCPVPDGLRAWGWQVQLYALRSRASWGIGDLGDLRALVAAAGREGAGLVLLNPLHAVLPVLPQENSPYYPASRRFTNPLYLRVEHCDGHDALGADERARVDALAAEARAANGADRIDRDSAFRRKTAALEVLAAQPLPPQREAAYAAYREAEGEGLRDFATAAALAERHGRSFRSWPRALRDPRSEAVAEARAELADRVAFHAWLQWQCDEQLAAAAAAARGAGMAVGLLTDLAVGVDPGGADAWALQADLAQGVTVGAPPDAFNQQGQDWQLPPLRPDRLAATGFAPFRDLVRSQLRHAGGLRIDHVLGLFRLFWIPEGAAASEGTYVRYPAAGLLRVLAEEAQAAGAVVVGEDLGTVERGVRETLRAHGVLGSRVLWFEREEREETGETAPSPALSAPEPPRLPAGRYPRLALTSVTTHDLPTAAGFLADEATRVRAALGQLGTDVATERARAAREHAELLDLLVADGVLAEDERDDRTAAVLALHAFVARTPSLLVTASLADGVGDLRQPNLPGTTEEYPNWRLPVATPTGAAGAGGLLPPSRPLLLEELLDHEGVRRLAAVLRNGRRSNTEAVRDVLKGT
jgi:4-alpha-glucanotransferase